jgi:hypothetical protein
MRRSRGTILTVDVGGSHVKVMTDAGRTKHEFSSDPRPVRQGDGQEGQDAHEGVNRPGVPTPIGEISY